jgi:exodeoxyribonuclease-3
LPGDPDDSQSRYIEAAVNGILIGGLYLPNGNPRPGPKFDYKLRWFDQLIAHAAGLLESGLPVMLAGDFNVMPTERDVYKPERWLDDALFAPEVREAFFRLTGQGWTDALRTIHPDETIYTFWDYFRNAYRRNAGLRIDHLLLSPALADRLVDAQVDMHVRGWEKTSDHAPVWIELADSHHTGPRSPSARLARSTVSCAASSAAPSPARFATPTARRACINSLTRASRIVGSRFGFERRHSRPRTTK